VAATLLRRIVINDQLMPRLRPLRLDMAVFDTYVHCNILHCTREIAP
jgi:hypothetical protein